MWLAYSLLFSTLILLAIGAWVYLVQKNVAYKFYFPAIVLFVLFSLVPISYSVYVSFTNLKTGHLLDRSHVVDLFLEEKVLDQATPLQQFKLFKKDKEEYLIVVEDKFAAQFSQKQNSNKSQQIKLIDLGADTHPEVVGHFSLMSSGEIFDFISQNNQIKFLHPQYKELSFFRTQFLGKIFQRYQLDQKQDIFDTILNVPLEDDTQEGQFKLNGEVTGPGYYTTVGLKNYKELLFDKELSYVFFKTFGWTLTWALLSVLFSFGLGTLMAILLGDFSEKTKLVYRLLLIIPYSIPFFISVLVFKGLLNKDFGEINHLLSYFGISAVPWLDHKYWARISVLLVNLWLGYPYMLLVVTGILQSIPKSIYEASALEGASRWQNFRFLTFPLVIRAMVPLLIGSFAFNLNNFVGIYLLTGGGPIIANATTPLGETDILISYTYRLAFEGSQGQNFASAAAVSMFIFAIVVTITLLNFRISKMFAKDSLK